VEGQKCEQNERIGIVLTSILHPVPPTNLAGPIVVAYALLDVFLIVALARILGTLMNKIGQPRVVGEILAGVLLGPTLLGKDLSFFLAPAQVRPVISAIATIALILFMLLAGTEYDRSVVQSRVSQAAILAVLAVGVPALLGFPLASVMHNATFHGPKGAEFLPFALFIGAALSVTAFPVMAHILMERGQLNSPMGALGIATTGIMSVLMFLYIAFAGIVASSGGFGVLVQKLALVAVFLVVSWYVVRPRLDRMVRSHFRNGAMGGDGMAIIFIGLILYGFLGDRLGIHSMVGAFFWGLLLPEDRAMRQVVAAKIRDIAMILFLPVFFAFSGFNTDLKLITVSVIPVLLLFLAAAIGGKFLAALPARAFGLTWKDAGVLAALFNTRGLLVLVAGLIGLQLEIITVATFTIIVVVALVTNLMTLPLLNLLESRRPETVPAKATVG
jgi:Kef-type K+ transport system membrane component KefB